MASAHQILRKRVNELRVRAVTGTTFPTGRQGTALEREHVLGDGTDYSMRESPTGSRQAVDDLPIMGESDDSRPVQSIFGIFWGKVGFAALCRCVRAQRYSEAI